MRKLIPIALCVTVLPGVVMSQDSDKYQCSFGDLQRRIEILHEPGVEVPCSVHYYKDTEAPGEQQVLWSADSDANYCTAKAEEFIAKLEGWDWDCGRGTDTTGSDDAAGEVEEAETEVEEDLIDDPDVLAPEDLAN